jgi:hypothetical protein
LQAEQLRVLKVENGGDKLQTIPKSFHIKFERPQCCWKSHMELLPYFSFIIFMPNIWCTISQLIATFAYSCLTFDSFSVQENKNIIRSLQTIQGYITSFKPAAHLEIDHPKPKIEQGIY